MEKIKIKVLVLGSSGMLGHILTNTLEQDNSFNVFNISRNKKINKKTIICNVTDFEKLQEIISDIKPEYIVNCVGILIEDSINNPDIANSINNEFPHILRLLATKLNFTIIHISTDCVFDGSTGNYDEDSKKTPVDIYGKTKSLGEIINNDHLTIRTSIIGPELKQRTTGLFCWVLSNASKTIEGFDKSVWSGLSTLELSKAISYCIKNNLKGLLHIHSKPITKYNLIELINQEFGLDIIVKKVNGKYSNKSLTSIRKDFNFVVKSHKEMLSDLKEFIGSGKFKY